MEDVLLLGFAQCGAFQSFYPSRGNLSTVHQFL